MDSVKREAKKNCAQVDKDFFHEKMLTKRKCTKYKRGSHLEIHWVINHSNFQPILTKALNNIGFG